MLHDGLLSVCQNLGSVSGELNSLLVFLVQHVTR